MGSGPRRSNRDAPRTTPAGAAGAASPPAGTSRARCRDPETRRGRGETTAREELTAVHWNSLGDRWAKFQATKRASGWATHSIAPSCTPTAAIQSPARLMREETTDARTAHPERRRGSPRNVLARRHAVGTEWRTAVAVLRQGAFAVHEPQSAFGSIPLPQQMAFCESPLARTAARITSLWAARMAS